MNIKERLRAALYDFASYAVNAHKAEVGSSARIAADDQRQHALDLILEFPMLGFNDRDIAPDEDCEVLILVKHTGTQRYSIRTASYRAFDDRLIYCDAVMAQDLDGGEVEEIGWMQMPDQGFLQDMADSV